MPRSLIHWLYGATLLTLPWAGVGLARLATGRDLGAGLQPAWLLLALATLGWGAAVLAAGRGRAQWGALPRPWRLGLLLILGAVALSAAGLRVAPAAETPGVALGRYLRQGVQLLIMLVFVLWPALWTRGQRRWRWTLRLLIGAALLQVGYGLLQGLHYYHPLPGFAVLDRLCTSNPAILSGSEELYLGDAFRAIPRLRGTVCEPLYLGSFLLLALPWLAVSDLSGRRRAAGGAALLLLLLMTWSRGAWLALLGQAALALLLTALGRRRRRAAAPAAGRRGLRPWLAATGGLGLVVIVVGLSAGWDVLLLPVQRLLQSFSDRDWSNLTRLYSMQAGWRAFLLSPLVGVGWGQFSWHFPLLVDPLGLQSQFAWPVVNNFPLQILCETGLIGLGVLLTIAGWLGRGVLRALTAPEPARRRVLAGAVALAGIWIQLLTFSQYNLPHIWVALGLLLAALTEARATGEAS